MIDNRRKEEIELNIDKGLKKRGYHQSDRNLMRQFKIFVNLSQDFLVDYQLFLILSVKINKFKPE